MKKNTMMRLAAVLLVVALLTTSVICGTFAKYTSADVAEDSARVAKWDIQLNGKNIAEEQFTFDLFKTIIDTKTDAEETDVATTEQLIAPGTKGEFEITLTNASEVNATYEITFTVDNVANIPVKFTVNGEEGLESITETALNMGDTVTYTVAWEWAYEGNDGVDTALGLKGTDTITVTADVIATQVD